MGLVSTGSLTRRATAAAVSVALLAVGLFANGALTPADAESAPVKDKAAQDRLVPVRNLPKGSATSRYDAVNASAAERVRARTQESAVWPKAQAGVLDLADGSAAVGPVRVSSSQRAGAKATVRAAVLDREAALQAGVDGVLVRLQPESAAAAAGARVRVDVDYAGFAHASGGDYGQRLTLWQLPLCAATATCRADSPEPARVTSAANDWKTSTVSGQVTLPKTPAAGTGSDVLLAVAAAASGPSGDYAATSLSESSTWTAGSNSGDFTWSYPMRTPPGVGGPAPELTVRYATQSVDGHNAATNNQPGWVGEGFSFAEAYVERRYKSCVDDGHAGKGDLCWGTDNATMMLNGKSVQIIKDDDTGAYKLSDDDGSRVERITGGASGDDDGEYWKVTIADGTQYFFGRTRLTGWTDGDPVTNSVWTVPVAGDDSGEPCYDSAGFAASFCEQAWRWNLDLVIDTNGNAMSQWYTPETNRYAKNGSTTTSASYVRGGWLSRIDYGVRNNRTSLLVNPAEVRVVFGVSERCVPAGTETCASLSEANKKAWPDVPYDQICGSTTDCGTRVSPTFFTRKRLTTVQTRVRTATGYRDVEQWALAHTFYDPGDGTDAVLSLENITHTGEAATPAVKLPEVDFDYLPGANRVDGLNDGLPKFNKHRLVDIALESGGRIFVDYKGLECATGMTLTPHTNTRRCFPVRWTPDGEPELVDWFHKYVVDKVTELDGWGGGDDVITQYDYPASGGAWRYTQADGIVKDKYRTWSDWRGYATVQTTVGQLAGEKSSTETLYYRGMDGDRLNPDGGTKQATVTDSTNTSVDDSDQYAGIARETQVFNGPGGARVTSTINAPWSTTTATQTRSWGTLRARIVQPGTSTVRTRLSNGSDRATRTVNGYDGYGRLVTIDDQGDTATSSDDRCSTTTYAARNATAWITQAPARVETVSTNCASAEAASRPDHVVSDARTFYDDGAYLAAPSKGNPTRAESVASYGAGAPVYRADSRTVYDALGRVTQTTDAAGNLSTKDYTDGPGGLIKTVATGAAPFGFTETTDLDPAFGQPTSKADANSRTTRLDYDALGRLTSVWLPDRASQTPNQKFAYSLSNTAASWVSTSVVQRDGTYRAAYQIYDGLLRLRQTQEPEPHGDRIITDTRYDARGQAHKISERFAAPGTASASPVTFVDTDLPGLTTTKFDGAGRPERAGFSIRGTFKWATDTDYGGDRVSVTPPAGGTATTAISDARGRATELRHYTASATPSGAYIKTTYAYDAADRLKTLTDDEGNDWSTEYDLRGNTTRQVDPDKGTTTFAYDELDQPKTATTANGTLAWVYDELGRKTEEHAGSATGPLRVKWVYDTRYKGQLYSSASYDDNGNAFTWRVYQRDLLYRPQIEYLDVPASETGLAGTYQYDTGYYADGTVQGNGLPTAGDLPRESVSYNRNVFGQQLTTWGGLPDGTRIDYVTASSYTPLGQLETRVLGEDGLTGQSAQAFGWEEGTGRLSSSSITRYNVNGTDANWLYTYDPAGNVTQLRDLPTASGTVADRQCFQYDKLRRLTQAWSATSACSIAPSTSTVGGAAPYWTSFGYDDINNRTAETKYNLTGGVNTTRTYDYPAAGSPRPHALTKLTSTANSTIAYDLGYDGVGNQVNRDTNGTRTQTFTWDVAGRLKTATSATGSPSSYLYDADGNRLLKRDSTGTTLYIRNTELHRDTAGKLTGTRYYSHNGEVIAVRKGGSAASGVNWQLNDHHGTASVNVNAATKAITKRWFDPFGNPRGTVPTWTTDKGFLGGTKDDTGFTHLGAREYNPSMGRFISVDPLMDLTDPASLNAYAYSSNNPATLSDPSGLMPNHEESSCGGCSPGPVGHPEPARYPDWRDSGGPGPDQLRRLHRVRAHVAEMVRGGWEWSPASQPKPPTLAEKAIEFGVGLHPGTSIFELYDCYGSRLGCEWAVIGVLPFTPSWAKDVGKHADEGADLLGDTGKTAGRMCSFSADTAVLMADGSTKPISEIEVGDEVLAADPETGEQVAKKVTHLWSHADELAELTVDGKALSTTDDHPFWDATDRRWEPARELQPGDRLLTASGRTVEVTKKLREQAHDGAAYNLTIDDIHTYFVLAGDASVLVHNTCPIPDGISPLQAASLDDLLALALDPNRVEKGLTAPGRALQKHGEMSQANIQKRGLAHVQRYHFGAKITNAERSELGDLIITEVLTDPNHSERVLPAAKGFGGQVREFVSPSSGYAVRWSMKNGSPWFEGFIEW